MADGEFFKTRHDLRSQLSALIDRGRWFLPNDSPEDYGATKPAAFRGVRHGALDALVSCLRILEALNYKEKACNPQSRDAAVEYKRTFVSHIQEALDPRWWNAEIANLRSSIGKAA
jgi:hypothetical protein